MTPLVTTDWLHGHLDDEDLRILDATVDVNVMTGRVESGRALWEQSHIPGAAFADLLGDLSDPHAPHPLTMPSADRFAAAMEELGVGQGTRVVVYDSRQSMWAARVWWMLRAFGFDEAAVLDGGFPLWTAEGRPVSSEPPPRRAATFVARPRPELVVGKEEVRAALDDPSTCLVDALSRREYSGELAFYGRAGHIPGAINVPARKMLDRETQRFRSEDELRALFRPALNTERVITYCGGGVAAASDAFVLHLLGHPRVGVYDGSMMEWAADRSLPLVTG